MWLDGSGSRAPTLFYCKRQTIRSSGCAPSQSSRRLRSVPTRKTRFVVNTQWHRSWAHSALKLRPPYREPGQSRHSGTGFVVTLWERMEGSDRAALPVAPEVLAGSLRRLHAALRRTKAELAIRSERWL